MANWADVDFGRSEAFGQCLQVPREPLKIVSKFMMCPRGQCFEKVDLAVGRGWLGVGETQGRESRWKAVALEPA